MDMLLKVQGLGVTVGEKHVVKGVNLDIGRGEIHALMGPNGSGKSSMAKAIIGHPSYELSEGSEILLKGSSITEKSIDERAREGVFVAFQSPVSIPGVKVFTFLREAYDNFTGERVKVKEFRDMVVSKMEEVGLDSEFLGRYVNDGFSGGERKKMEMLQALLYEPKLMIFDEIDSGLDVDSLKVVAKGIRQSVESKENAVVIISHYKRILEYVKPNYVHVMREGKLVKSGGAELVEEIEENGYASIGSNNE